MSAPEVPEVRWCGDSAMVLRRAEDGTWMVLDTIGEADDGSVVASVRLLPPGQLRHEAAEIRAAFRDGDRARQRAARTRTALGAFLGTLLGAFGAVVAGAALGRWSR